MNQHNALNIILSSIENKEVNYEEFFFKMARKHPILTAKIINKHCMIYFDKYDISRDNVVKLYEKYGKYKWFKKVMEYIFSGGSEKIKAIKEIRSSHFPGKSVSLKSAKFFIDDFANLSFPSVDMLEEY